MLFYRLLDLYKESKKEGISLVVNNYPFDEPDYDELSAAAELYNDMVLLAIQSANHSVDVYDCLSSSLKGVRLPRKMNLKEPVFRDDLWSSYYDVIEEFCSENPKVAYRRYLSSQGIDSVDGLKRRLLPSLSVPRLEHYFTVLANSSEKYELALLKPNMLTRSYIVIDGKYILEEFSEVRKMKASLTLNFKRNSQLENSRKKISLLLDLKESATRIELSDVINEKKRKWIESEMKREREEAMRASLGKGFFVSTEVLDRTAEFQTTAIAKAASSIASENRANVSADSPF